MSDAARLRTESYLLARRQHPAWLLLASPRAPLLLSCLQSLFTEGSGEIPIEDAREALASILSEHANDEAMAINSSDYSSEAQKELRAWVRKGLIIERDGLIMATDALEKALTFASSLDNRLMTSTASRLSTVQREIENLESRLDPDPASRAAHIRQQIQRLERELTAIAQGDFEVLEGPRAQEGIREVYSLATSLLSDFRRVEDSYREADKALRHSIISDEHHRGEIVDKLLDSHDHLLQTSEGQVFHSFHQQLGRSVELDAMKLRLRKILRNPATQKALTLPQASELRWLLYRLVKDSERVIQARARSERDVKGFLETGLAAEHHRVGRLLNDLLGEALSIDWSSQSVRRSPAPLPPIPVAVGALPLLERLRFKEIDDTAEQSLDLQLQDMNLNDIEDDFWQAFDGLDREALFRGTLEVLKVTGAPMSLADLASHLPPSHDLETLALWLSMAREAGVEVDEALESIEVIDPAGGGLRFSVPKVALTHAALAPIDWDL
ncbi:DUF3375 domain-containing protein [Allohahella marinimesophila]